MDGNQKSQRECYSEGRKARPGFGWSFEFPYAIERWYPLLLILITLGVFHQNAFMDFTYDDRVVVVDNPKITRGDLGAIWFEKNGYFKWGRQVRAISFMVDYALFGFSPVGWHLHNLFWHLLCVVLVYILLNRLFHQATFSFFGALIFALHPIHVEAVTNISNRKELLGLAFLLIAFLSYIQFLEGKTRRRWAWLMVGTVSWGLALFSKQFTVILPLLLVTYEYLFLSKNQRFLTKNTPLLLSLIGLASLFMFLYVITIMDVTNLKTSERLNRSLHGYRGELTYISLVATSGRTFWTYIQLLIWPVGLCPDHVVDLSKSFFEFRVTLAWAGLIAFIVIIFLVAPKWPVLAFGMIWFFIGYFPISNWIPSAFLLADRYMYMPSVGYCIVLVTLSQAFYRRLLIRRSLWAFSIVGLLATALTIGYANITLAYNAHWSNSKTFWEYTMGCNPDAFRGFSNLGDYYLEQGLFAKAREHYSKAIELGHLDAYNNRGNMFYEMKNYEAALKDYNKIITLMPGWGKPYSNRGVLFYAQQQYDRAVRDFTKALELTEEQPRLLNLRGLAYEKLGQWSKARSDYGDAIASDRYNGELYFNLGRVQLHQDELQAAILSYQKAKELGFARAEDVLQVLRKKGYLE